MPNDTAKILIQKQDIRIALYLPVKRLRPSNTAMKEARPTVKAGSRKCQPMTQANWIRDKKRGSKLIVPRLCLRTPRRLTPPPTRAARYYHRELARSQPYRDRNCAHGKT